MSEIKVKVRCSSGCTIYPNTANPVRLVTVSGGPKRPMLWIGAGERDGIAWIGGRTTLIEIRDAINEVLELGDD